MYNNNYKRLKNKRHLEDTFDLDQYNADIKNKKHETDFKQNKKVINFISVLIVVFSTVLVVLFFQLFNYYMNLHKNSQISEYSKNTLGDGYINTPNTAPFDVSNKDNHVVNADTNGSASLNNAPALKEIKPEILNLRTFFDNEDIVGHIKVPGTNIDYDVVQGFDNEYYLNRDLYKNKNDAGSIYMDEDNVLNPLSKNIILFGHNMRNGSMFHNVRNYRDYEYFKTNKYIDLMTTYQNTRWEIFCFYETHTDFNYIDADYVSVEAYQEFLDEIVARSHFVSDVEITTDDNILTLSTCTNVSDDTRFVVHAKLIETY